MSDLRLEDLRVVNHRHRRCGDDCPVLVLVTQWSEPVSRREVLEALGAEKQWMCVDRDADERCNDWDAHDTSKCGWVWVVDDAT